MNDKEDSAFTRKIGKHGLERSLNTPKETEPEPNIFTRCARWLRSLFHN